LALFSVVLSSGCGAARVDAGARVQTPRSVASQSKKPRYFVQIGLLGGMDSVYATDPKTRAAVEPWVDVPFESSQIVATRQGEFGPGFRDLAPWSEQLAILRGVVTHTVNHDHGTWQFGRMKARTDRQMPLLMDLVGSERRDSQALALLQLSPPVLHEDTSPHLVSSISDETGREGLLPRLQSLDAEAGAALSRQLQRMAQPRGASAAEGVSRDNILQASAFLAKVAAAKPFVAERWSAREGAGAWSLILQQALWALDNDLTCALEIYFPGWDSHANNHQLQSAKGALFGELFARFLRELKARRNAHGSLLDQTVGVVGSELGRLPRLNVRGGKDHLPEAPFFFFGGRHIRPGIYGTTDRRMVAEPVDLRSGQPSRSGERMSLENVGATLLAIAGMDPELYGYGRAPLRFVESA
jgi:hypothetical protein